MKNKTHSAKKINSARKHEKKQRSDLVCLNPNAAGIDIGAREIVVAVPTEENQYNVWTFETFTRDLHEIVDLLKTHNVTSVAMESTGVYWISLYEIIEDSNIRPLLVNPKNFKNGKKTDVSDAEWLATLLKYGLVAGAFRPREDYLTLRGYIRQRSLLIEHRSPHILHIDKALIQMNLRLSNVVSDIMGQTGLAIIRAIVRGERDPKKLAALRHERCKNSEEIIEKSLEGHYKEDQVFALKQALQAYDFYQNQIDECEKEIEKIINQLEDMPPQKTKGSPFKDFSPPSSETVNKNKKKRNNSKNAFKFNAHELACKKTGVDLTKIDGLSEQNIWLILSEIGVDMTPWLSEKHFTSWLGLCPNNMVSGGKTLKRHTKRSKQRARQALMLAAYSLHSSKSALGAYYRRMRAKLGPEKAIVATAHKLARLLYHMLKFGEDYVDLGQEEYERRYRERVLKGLQRKANELGFVLIQKENVA